MSVKYFSVKEFVTAWVKAAIADAENSLLSNLWLECTVHLQCFLRKHLAKKQERILFNKVYLQHDLGRF